MKGSFPYTSFAILFSETREQHGKGVFCCLPSGTDQTDAGKSGFRDTVPINERTEAMDMFRPKGYSTSNGYIGFLPNGRRMVFPTQGEYLDFLAELSEEAA